MKRVFLAVLTILLVLGCAGHKPQPPRAINKRIIYRDLTKPVDEPEQNANHQKSIINESARPESLTESKSKDDD